MDAEVGAGRQKAKRKSFMDVVKEDEKLVGVRIDSAEDRVTRRQMIGCCHPGGKNPEGMKTNTDFFSAVYYRSRNAQEIMWKTKISQLSLYVCMRESNFWDNFFVTLYCEILELTVSWELLCRQDA